MTFNAIKPALKTFASVTFHIPQDKVVEWDNFCRIMDNKHAGYMSLKADKPFKPRTTGEKSQNNKVHAFYSQLIKTGYTISEIKYTYVLPAAVKHGYPTKTGLDGKEIPKHESEISTSDISAEIQGIFDIAELMEITLYEKDGSISDRIQYLL